MFVCLFVCLLAYFVARLLVCCFALFLPFFARSSFCDDKLRLFLCLFVCLFVGLFVCLFVCLFVLIVCLFACLLASPGSADGSGR